MYYAKQKCFNLILQLKIIVFHGFKMVPPNTTSITHFCEVRLISFSKKGFENRNNSNFAFKTLHIFEGP